MAASVPILFALILGLWWARVTLALGLAWGGAPVVALVAAAIVFALATISGRGFVRDGAGAAARISRGFLALGLSFGLGALPLALAAMRHGEAVGAQTAAEGANPFGAILGMPLAPILAGNLVAGLMLGLAAVAAAVCLLLAALFNTAARRK